MYETIFFFWLEFTLTFRCKPVPEVTHDFCFWAPTFRGCESRLGGSSFVVAAEHGTHAGVVSKSLDNNSKAVLSSMVFYGETQDFIRLVYFVYCTR